MHEDCVSRFVAMVAAVGVAASSGCATTLAATQILTGGSKTWCTDGSEQTVTPIDERQQTLDVEVASMSPLSLECTLRERTPREHVHIVWHRWGQAWSILSGIAFFTEAAGSAIALTPAFTRDDTRGVPAGTYLAADALATGILFLVLEPTSSTSEEERGGLWTTSKVCPEGLVIVGGGGEDIPIDAQGQPPREAAGALGHAVLTGGASVTVRWGVQVEKMSPTIEQRCEWARAHGDPATAPLCAAWPPPPPAAPMRPEAPRPDLRRPPLVPGLRLRFQVLIPRR
jgi:hypothetical protein